MSGQMERETTRGDDVSQRRAAEQLRLKRLASVVLYFIGGLTAASGVLTTSPTPDAATVRFVAGGILAFFGVLALVLPVRRLTLDVMAHLSVLVISGMMATLDPVGMVPFFYLWPVVFSAYFSSARVVVSLMVTMAISEAVALQWAPGVVLKFDTWNGSLICVGLMAGVVLYMQRREVRLRADLEVAASTDPLTSLLNRRALNPSLEARFEEARTAEQALSLVLIDVDHFKRFNDTHGHVAGDVALQRLAAVLREEAGVDDLVGRFGGEEFAVVMPGSGVAGARHFASRIAGRLCGEDIDPSLKMTVSSGVAEVDGVDSLDQLLSRADEALYAAKDAGRARAAWWERGVICTDRRGAPEILAA